MKKVTLNIGLNVGNIEPETQLSQTANVLSEFLLAIIDIRVCNGTWEGAEERTVVCAGLIPSYFGLHDFNKIPLLLQQDCIAVIIEGEITQSSLVYSPTFEGDKMEFDGNYFISIISEPVRPLCCNCKYYIKLSEMYGKCAKSKTEFIPDSLYFCNKHKYI